MSCHDLHHYVHGSIQPLLELSCGMLFVSVALYMNFGRLKKMALRFSREADYCLDSWNDDGTFQVLGREHAPSVIETWFVAYKSIAQCIAAQGRVPVLLITHSLFLVNSAENPLIQCLFGLSLVLPVQKHISWKYGYRDN